MPLFDPSTKSIGSLLLLTHNSLFSVKYISWKLCELFIPYFDFLDDKYIDIITFYVFNQFY